MSLTPEIVRSSVEAAFPALTVHDCLPVGEGWDSVAWLVNGSLIFRFPKRSAVAEALRREIALLPDLAPTLPVAIPRFTFIAERGAPTDPALPFVGYPLLSGLFLDTVPGLLHETSPLLPQLADFLRALHRFPPEQAVTAGLPAIDWTAWVAHWERFAARLMIGESARFTPATRARLAAWHDELLAELHCAARPIALLHHDLALEHLLVVPEGARLTGVIDWGDIALGDPALDFVGIAGACSVATLDTLLTAYGPVDEGFQRRIAWYGWLAPFHLLGYGLDVADATIVTESVGMIEGLMEIADVIVP
ncbi:MAG TPA: phosphotransferase [Thermomicrobiales bacterium]|jgi:aminoglycoside phosphotransferase (APT) family kinase protein